jgi:phosphoribosylanthranilate isomerase
MLVKICGITRLEDAVEAANAGADAVGFNFWRPGKRYIDPDAAAKIGAELPREVRRVGVFVNETLAAALEIALRADVEVLQFHGSEPLTYLSAIESYVKWKAIRVGGDWTPATLGEYAGVEAFLLDAPGATPGGTGQTFDWNAAVAAKQWGRIILAGGLTPANVAAAVRTVQPWGVDVASGVEDAPGIKNHQLMREFIRAARSEEKQ